MEYIIEMLNITKSFPGIIANDHITLQLKKGEIHALLGENGAGKTTLMSILFGLYQPDDGIMIINGKRVSINNPNDANRLGIGMVHQHFKLVQNFTVLDNIILGAEPTRYGFINRSDARKKILALSKQYKLQVDPDALVENISVGMGQRVEILKMLYRENDILIFDEPTAVLTPDEIEELMIIMKDLAKSGKSILFITHKLSEILAVASRCTVLRKGSVVGTVIVANTDKHELSKMMVGREIDFIYQKEKSNLRDEILKVNNLTIKSPYTKKNLIDNISLSVSSGEIVCIAGIEGNGQSELIYAISGLMKVDSGHIYIKEKEITSKSIRYRNKLGISHIPADRHRHGLVLDYSLANNLIIKKYLDPAFQHFGFIKFNKIEEYANQLIEQFDIRSAEGSSSIMRNMSGGNQQKAIIARELDLKSSLLLAVQPTRGLDVGAIESIHKMLLEERKRGRAILLVSLELDEVISLSDRILVIYEGRIVKELNPLTSTIKEIGFYMAGGHE